MMSLVLALLLESSASAPRREDQVLIMGLAAGSQTAETATDAVTRAEFSYNDRGRGDHIIATWKLEAAGVPTQYSGSGNDYMKAPIEETFLILGNKATWKNRAEEGGRTVRGEAFQNLLLGKTRAGPHHCRRGALTRIAGEWSCASLHDGATVRGGRGG